MLKIVCHEGSWLKVDQDTGEGLRILEKEVFKILASPKGPTSPISDSTNFVGQPGPGKFQNIISFTQQEGTPDFVFDVVFPKAAFLGYKGYWASLDIQWDFDPSDSIIRTDGWQWEVDVSSLFEKGLHETTKYWKVSDNLAQARQIFSGIIKGWKMRISVRTSIDQQMLSEGISAVISFPLRCIAFSNSARALDLVTLSESAGSTSVSSSLCELNFSDLDEPGDGLGSEAE